MIARAIKISQNRYLPIESSLLEAFVGLIMVLGTTNSVAVAALRSDYGVNALLAASFGTAMAWGIVVGSLNVLVNYFKRTRRNRILTDVRAAPDQLSAVAILEDEFDVDVLETFMKDAEHPTRTRLSWRRRQSLRLPRKPRPMCGRARSRSR